MEQTRCLALLLCDGATRAANGKVNLYGVFDRIQIKVDSSRPDLVVGSETPAHLNNPTAVFFVFYKVIATESSTLQLVVEDPTGRPVTGQWLDEIPQPGLIQTLWCLNLKDFASPGTYTLRLIRGQQTLSETLLEVADARNGNER
jgi:hypothetical protein